MIRDSNIPLFLWVATALCVHFIWGGGAEGVVQLSEQSREIRRFAQEVHRRLASTNQTLEVSLLDDSGETVEVEAPEAEPAPPEADENSELAKPEELEAPEKKPEPPKPEEKKQAKPEVTPPAPKEPEKLPLPVEPAPAEEKRPPTPLANKIAVEQHVADKNQKDNPNAEFIGNHANHVAEQTQARITSTDQNDPNPTPGRNFAGPDENPGNANETALAQSEERPGELTQPTEKSTAKAPPELELSQKPAPSAAEPKAPAPAPSPAAPAKSEQRQANAVSADPGQKARAAAEAVAETITAEQGADAVARAQEARPGSEERKKRLAQSATTLQKNPLGWLGLGSSGTTANGINLNLTPQSALASIGRPQLERERVADSQRRLTAHRGSWKANGLERWRSAIENYVPSVKPGNQTALNTAASPFASYLNRIHNQLHPHFAFDFLPSLDRLPTSHPLNRPEMHAELEIVVSGQDGRIVRMGVTHTSGVTAFDIGALESVQRASPFGTPPQEILSPDGNAYLHWEFYREPNYACSTHFARPFLLKLQPKPADPPVLPPPPARPNEENVPAEPERRGERPAPDLEKHAALR